MRQRTYISTGRDADKIASYTNACFEHLCIKRHYLLTVHDTVCLHNLESRLLHNISSLFNLKLALQKLKWHVSRETNCTKIKETSRVHLIVRTPSKKLTAKLIETYHDFTARNSRNTLQLKILPEKITKETFMGKHVKGMMYFSFSFFFL